MGVQTSIVTIMYFFLTVALIKFTILTISSYFFEDKVSLCCPGLELLDWRDPPASAYQIAGTAGKSHHAYLPS